MANGTIDQKAIGKLQPGVMPDLGQPGTCTVCGLVAPAAFADKPKGSDFSGNKDPKLAAQGFVPQSPSPLDGWTFDHLSGACYCPDHEAPKKDQA